MNDVAKFSALWTTVIIVLIMFPCGLMIYAERTRNDEQRRKNPPQISTPRYDVYIHTLPSGERIAVVVKGAAVSVTMLTEQP